MMESSALQTASSLGTTASVRKMVGAGRPVEDAIECSSGTRSLRCESWWRIPSISIWRSTGMLRGSITGRSRSRVLTEGLNAISGRRGSEGCHRKRRPNTFRYVEMAGAIPSDLPWGADGLAGQCRDPRGVPAGLHWGRFAIPVAESHVVQACRRTGNERSRPVNGAATIAVVGKVSY